MRRRGGVFGALPAAFKWRTRNRHDRTSSLVRLQQSNLGGTEQEIRTFGHSSVRKSRSFDEANDPPRDGP